MKKLIIGMIIFSVFLVGCGPDTTYDEFAKCLTSSDTKFYGAFWCPHCESVKEQFRDSAKYLPYVECDPRGDNSQSNLCTELGIERYPTFIFSDGSRLVGAGSMSELSQRSGCSLP